MMKGLPASGKSTRAKEIVREGGNFVRINRDLIREMLHFNKFSYRNEGRTINAEKYLAREFLSEGLNVIIDDCNLGQNHENIWRAIANQYNAAFKVLDLTQVDIHECIKRDSERERKVGYEVIMNMALEYEIYEPAKGFVICDIDGTISDPSHRLHYLKGEKKDWKGFFSQMSKDTVKEDTLKMLHNCSEDGYDIVFVSARPEDYKEETKKWLSDNLGSLVWQTVIMRKSGDRRDDVNVKRDILNKYFTDRSKIYKVIDDRPSVVQVWKDEGLDVIDVGPGPDNPF